MRGVLIAAILSAPAFAAPPDARTAAANAAVSAALPFADRDDYALADAGFVATLDDPVIRAADGTVLRDLRQVAFLAGDAPASVNPSLWRNAQLTAKHGLFEVRPGIWQVRGFDLSNMTLVAGKTGWIVIDPLTTAEAAKAALGLANKHLGTRPVAALVYTHSHVDHFGGARGVVADGQKLPIYAPHGFLEHAVGENVIAGNAMGRRATYMFGAGLAPGPEGHVGTGIGPRGSGGTMTLLPPTVEVKATGETHVIDGVTFEFQLTPGTEAPAEMNFYLPELRALCLAENANAGMHNLLTPRGALIRDAKVWADYLTEARRRYADRSDVLFTSHHWPRRESAKIADYIERHRDAYKFVHDQSVRLMNAGYTGVEIGNRLQLPPALASAWFNRGNYGTVSFNARAVYQRYMGHYDGNPVNLDPLSPEDSARRYVAALGGAKKVLALAAKSDDDRWRAELLGRLVFAEPANQAARQALAAVLEQLAYRAESAPWRNIYLSGAQDLRGSPRTPAAQTAAFDLARAMPMASLLDLLAVRLVPEKAGDTPLLVAFVDRADGNRRHLVRIANGVLVHEAGAADPATATLSADVPTLLAMMTGAASVPTLMAAGKLGIEGDPAALARFASLFETPPAAFNLVEP
jgi:alkyl sulfatase BDS1-like metallo-beta-lactamase superfamily hydrolase